MRKSGFSGAYAIFIAEKGKVNKMEQTNQFLGPEHIGALMRRRDKKSQRRGGISPLRCVMIRSSQAFLPCWAARRCASRVRSAAMMCAHIASSLALAASC